ncbi:MAG: ATP-binding protein [Acidobacteriota bacterium]
MKIRLAGSALSLAIGVTIVAASVSAVAAYLYSAHHFESMLETTKSAGLAQGELIRAALEHQMIEKDRSLLGQMIRDFGRQPGVVNVMLLDRLGDVKYMSGSHPGPQELSIDSPTCQACHALPSDKRNASQAIETREGTVLRTMVPIRNRESCYRCHDAGQTVNGILVFDLDVGPVREAMNRDFRWMVTGTGGMIFVLVGAIALVIRLVVVRRLQRIESTARQIVSGDLEQRVHDEGSDTISWLAREFNTMADSVTGLLGEVRSQRERLETVINSIDDGIVVLDARRNVIAANEAFLQRTGRYREQVLGCCCTDLGPGLCTMDDCPTLSCLASGERQVRICQLRDPGGQVRWEEVHASPITDAGGSLIQVVEVWRDITERRAAEARMAESHRMASLGMLASGFSHELNTPLATVLTCVEGILRDAKRPVRDAADAARVADYAAVARDQVLRCRGITQHFLRLSRGQSSSGDLVDLQRTVAAVERLVEPTARAHAVTTVVGAVPAGLHVRADEAELQHTLINLMLNAIQACAAGGRVTLEVRTGEAVGIRVTDDGCGIASDDRKRIFEPFFSLRKGGTGLGLFLSLNFVRQWGGDILVTSALGGGSTFEVVLPAAAAREARSA